MQDVKQIVFVDRQHKIIRDCNIDCILKISVSSSFVACSLYDANTVG